MEVEIDYGGIVFLPFTYKFTANPRDADAKWDTVECHGAFKVSQFTMAYPYAENDKWCQALFAGNWFTITLPLTDVLKKVNKPVLMKDNKDWESGE